MMVETILDSSQDFGMSNGVLPQWKRELLQRRAARSRPAPPSAPAPPPAPPPPPEEDEELRYGPGIVKRLKSRYLSLALRDAPRRRPSVLRRAASLEHLLDERPPPAPRPQRQRPVSLAPVCPAALPPRRDSVKRARSVDALSRLEREEPPPSPPPPPPIAPRPSTIRAARPPRRPAPLLRETERPPPDVVKSTLRKFESAPTRRTAPAARVSAVLRGFAVSTPEPKDRSPSPINDVSIIDDPESPLAIKTVSRAALDGIAQAGSTVRYSFEAPKRGSHLPLVSASNPVLLGRARLSPSPRRVGVIRPMPAPTLERSVSTPAPMPEDIEKIDVPRIVTPPPSPIAEPETPKEKKETPSALVEPIPRSPPEEIKEIIRNLTPPREVTPEPPKEPKIEVEIEKPEIKTPELNGHVERKALKTWKSLDAEKEPKENGDVKSWTRGGSPAAARRGRVPAPAATSIVFNFSGRKEVPDYIENDGIILRNKRDKIKASDPGVVVLRPEALARDSDSDEPDDCGPPSPLAVRFVNDNVLINGKSSMPGKPDRSRTARLKIQFDDSLTRTFEYPSETSLCEDPPSPPPVQPPAHQAALAANTHIASASLSRYTPHNTLADAFQLGVTRHEAQQEHTVCTEEAAAESADARPCAADCARTWSEARTHATDLLFLKSVAWSQSGQLLATCGRDKSVWMWEVAGDDEYECASVLNAHNQDVKKVAWHPTLDILASASHDNTVKLYKEDPVDNDWSCVATLQSHESTVWSLAFDQTGERLATCSDDRTVKIWKEYKPDNQEGVQVAERDSVWKCVCTLSGFHSRCVYDIAWCHKTGLIATACGDDLFRIFRETGDSDPNAPTFDLVCSRRKLCCVESCWEPRIAFLC